VAPAGDGESATQAISAAPPRTLVHLSPGDIALYGIVENRGLFVIAAAIGVLWEYASVGSFFERFFGDGPGRLVVDRIGRWVNAETGATWRFLVLSLVFVAVLLIISRAFSIVWALIRLHGFTVVQAGEDLRTEYGLLTRVVQTIPRRRIQTITVRQTPLHRLFKRASVRVATAGSTEQRRDSARREWFAPIIREREVPALLATLVPGVHPRAIWRVFRRSLIVAALGLLLVVFFVGWQGLWLSPVFIAWAAVSSRWYTRNLGWATTREIVGFRTGTLVRALTIAPLVRIQCVSLHESPFDRRTGMARVRADTAGTGGGGYHVDVPYLPRETADQLHGQLSVAAATTAFQW
jgi:putative membrane protein